MSIKYPTTSISGATQILAQTNTKHFYMNAENYFDLLQSESSTATLTGIGAIASNGITITFTAPQITKFYEKLTEIDSGITDYATFKSSILAQTILTKWNFISTLTSSESDGVHIVMNFSDLNVIGSNITFNHKLGKGVITATSIIFTLSDLPIAATTTNDLNYAIQVKSI